MEISFSRNVHGQKKNSYLAAALLQEVFFFFFYKQTKLYFFQGRQRYPVHKAVRFLNIYPLDRDLSGG